MKSGFSKWQQLPSQHLIYHTVTIRSRYLNNGNEKWVAEIHKSRTDRVESYTAPSALGHYHYPDTMSDEKAFSLLKGVMVKRHKDEMKKLKRSLDKLKPLEL
jgi:RNA polymerase-binding transcription factor DksA